MTAAGERRRGALRAARLYLIVTPEALGDDAEVRVREALSSGAIDLVQLRTKAPQADALVRAATWLAPLAADAGVPWLLNDDPSRAAALGADGVHVGEDDAAPADARALVGVDRLLGVSTHDAAEVRRAAAGPADHAGLGPCFPSSTKALRRTPQGPMAIAQALAGAPVHFPVFAIGGIDVLGAARLAEAGVPRLAVGHGILGARSPADAAAAIAACLPPRG